MDFGLQNNNTFNLGNLNNGIPNSIPTTPNVVNSVPEQPVYVQQPVQPVYSPVTTAVPEQPQQPVYTNVNTQVTQTVTLEQPQPQVIPEVQTEVNANTNVAHKVVAETEKVISNNGVDGVYRVNTTTIQSMMNNISKSITYEPRIPLSVVTQFKFTPEGLELAASNGETFIVQRDVNNKSTNEVCIGVDTKLFKSLIDKIDVIEDPEFTIICEKENHIITVKTENGDFKFREQYDIGTGEAINIPLPEDMLNLPTMTINEMVKFQQIMNDMKGFSGKSDANRDVAGVYIEPESISANDKNNFSLAKGIPEFGNNVIFFSNEFINAFKDVYFGETAQIGLKIDEGCTYPSRLIIKNENAMVIGPAMEQEYYDTYPLQSIKRFAETSFGQSITLNRTKLLNTLDRTQLFIEQNDRDVLYLTIEGKGLRLKSKLGTADELIRVESVTGTVQRKDIYAKVLGEALKILSSDDVAILADDNVSNIIGIKTDVMTTILSLDNE